MFSFLFWLFRDALFFFGMLSGPGGSFPKPLSRQEEKACIEKMKQGDEDARQTLITHNLRLVSHIANKYTVPGYTREDLVSVGALGLVKAVNTYKPENGSPLGTYAARCIENEILMLLRASRKYKGEVSLTEPIGTDGEGNDLSFMDILGTPEDELEEKVMHRLNMEKVRLLIAGLPKRERLVIEMRYGLLDGCMHPQHEVARILGISRSYVSRMEKRAIELLQEGMGVG